MPCLHSNFENSVDDQYLNQLVDGFKIENLIIYVEHAEHYAKRLKDDAVFCLERDWAKYGCEYDFKRRLNADIQQKEMLHLAHFLEHLDFIQDTKKYAELDPYSLQKTRPEWKADGLSTFFNERISKLQQDLKETIQLKQEFNPRIDETKNVIKQKIEHKELEQHIQHKPILEPQQPSPNNDFKYYI